MNIKVIYSISAGTVTYQPGELVTLPDADALACIKCGAAEPADRRARRLVAESTATEQASLAREMAQHHLANSDKRPRDGNGFVLALQVADRNQRAPRSI